MFKFITIFLFVTAFYQTVSAQGDHISMGIGPSLIYSDNSGEYRDFKFKVEPAITLAFNKQITEYIALRGSLGAQMFNSGEYDLIYPSKLVEWGNQDQAFGFKGRGYFLDLMPIFTTNPNAAGMITSTLLFYAGLGFGIMYVERDEEILKNGVLIDGNLVDSEIISSNEISIIPYVPIRIGISTNFSGNWDYAVEFVLITTTNSELDGNNIKDKTLTPDMLGQIQFTIKRYIGQAW